MRQTTEKSEADRVINESRGALDEVLREGARSMLQSAIEVEVEQHLETHKYLVDHEGLRRVVGNGHKPKRELVTGVGPIEIRQPRVHDRRKGKQFTSAILPPYLRRVPKIDALIPYLYLKGISTGDFSEALAGLLGEKAAGLSASNIVRLKKIWEQDYKEWSARSLEGKRYVYMWADGVYFNVRLTDERPCLLIIMGTLENGTKELISIYDGERESKLSWQEVLRDLKRRGLKQAPELAVGDGALGFWAALEEEFPSTREQRCWVHKTANLLDKLPKKLHPSAKKLIHDMYMVETKKDALATYDEFINLFAAKYPKACECLSKDKEVLFTFYDFPAEHWAHIRTTNPIESMFATVRHRTRQTKGCGSRLATLSMVFQLAREAEKHWRKINSYELIEKLIEGVRFEDGVEAKAA